MRGARRALFKRAAKQATATRGSRRRMRNAVEYAMAALRQGSMPPNPRAQAGKSACGATGDKISHQQSMSRHARTDIPPVPCAKQRCARRVDMLMARVRHNSRMRRRAPRAQSTRARYARRRREENVVRQIQQRVDEQQQVREIRAEMAIEKVPVSVLVHVYQPWSRLGRHGLAKAMHVACLKCHKEKLEVCSELLPGETRRRHGEGMVCNQLSPTCPNLLKAEEKETKKATATNLSCFLLRCRQAKHHKCVVNTHHSQKVWQEQTHKKQRHVGWGRARVMSVTWLGSRWVVWGQGR